MCGRYTLTMSPDQFARDFGVKRADAARLVARFNIAPGQPVALVMGDANRRSEPGGSGETGRVMDHAIWGLIPSWSKDPTAVARLINARSETVLEKPSFKASFLHRRCLIPADGYYEWKRIGARKQPYFFKLKSGRSFAMAGIWSDWEDGDGGQMRTCAILTRPAEGSARAIHDRMPVLVSGEAQERWLDSRLSAPAESLRLLAQPAAQTGDWDIHPVSEWVNNPRNDGPECAKILPAPDSAVRIESREWGA